MQHLPHPGAHAAGELTQPAVRGDDPVEGPYLRRLMPVASTLIIETGPTDMMMSLISRSS
jgi:hypothetical protein